MRKPRFSHVYRGRVRGRAGTVLAGSRLFPGVVQRRRRLVLTIR